MTDFRALCAELLDEFVYHTDWSDAEELKDRARAALADGPAVPQPQPSAEGEVAELVAWLRDQDGWMGTRVIYSRIAELLQRLSPPQPVQVSERLPGPEDCDDQKRCWWLVHQSWPCLYLMKADSGLAAAVATHWLPAHALPVPGQEVR